MSWLDEAKKRAEYMHGIEVIGDLGRKAAVIINDDAPRAYALLERMRPMIKDYLDMLLDEDVQVNTGAQINARTLLRDLEGKEETDG